MLKKFISMAVVCLMLVSSCIPAFADTVKTYDEYVLTGDLGDFTTRSITDPLYYGSKPGSSVKGKMNDTVYEMSAKGGSGAVLDVVLEKANISTVYSEGEKVHISAELMVPAGTEFRTYQNGGPGLTLTAITNKEATETASISVPNNGTTVARANKIISFNSNNRITLFGGSIYTNMNWAYDQWYKFDIVIVMGEKPKAAIYVDGQPLTINVDFGNGVNVSGAPVDATFDGIKTTSDYIDIGKRVSGEFVSTGIYGISSVGIHAIKSDNVTKKSTLYLDNIIYRGMSETDIPAIDTSFGIKGILDGSVVDRADLKDTEIVVPTWFAHQTAKLTLSVDGDVALEDSSAPYTFDLSKLERGVRHLTLVAYDASGDVIKEAVKTLTVAGNEEKTLLYNDMEAAWAYDGSMLYYGSSPALSSQNTDGCKTSFENVTDSAAVTKKAAKLYSNGTKEMNIGYKNVNMPKTGTVNISYDMYLNNTNASSLFFTKNNRGYSILSYSNGKFSTNTGNYGVGASVSFDAKVGYWQTWNWIFDFERSKLSLIIDGETKIDNVSFSKNHWTSEVFNGFQIYFKAAEETENFIAVDNFDVSRYTGIPAVKYDMYDYNNNKSWSEYTVSQMKTYGLGNTQVQEPDGDYSGIYAGKVMNSDNTAPLNESFGDSIIGNFSSSDAYASKACQIPFVYKRAADYASTSTYIPQYGKFVAEFDLYLDNINHAGVGLYLDNTSFASIASGTSRIKICGADTKFDVTYGQWQRYKLVFDYNKGNLLYITMYVDGNQKWCGRANSAYMPNSASRYASNFRWNMSPAKDTADTTKYAENMIALDNISFDFKPVTPYISSVDFGADNYTDGIVKTSANTAKLTVSGIAFDNNSTHTDVKTKQTNTASKISIIDLESGNPVADATVTSDAISGLTANTRGDDLYFTISNLELEAGKKYKILLDLGLGFDKSNYFATNEPSSFIFTAADNFPLVVAPDDGVAGDITVTDVRFTTNNALPLSAGALKGYTGGSITKGKQLRADVMVNNASSEAQTFRVVIATYENGELTGLSLGEECTVLPKAESMVFTTGDITMTEDKAPDIKVMIFNDTDTIIPVSKAFSLEN